VVGVGAYHRPMRHRLGLAFSCTALATGTASQEFTCDVRVAVLGGCVQRRESRFLVTVDVRASVEQQARER